VTTACINPYIMMDFWVGEKLPDEITGSRWTIFPAASPADLSRYTPLVEADGNCVNSLPQVYTICFYPTNHGEKGRGEAAG
jgi:hypothetical protein